MKKKPLAAVLALCLILAASGCSQLTEKPSAEEPARLSTPSETVEKNTPEEPTTKAAVTTAATTEAKKQSFPYSFDELYESAKNLDTDVNVMDPVELDNYNMKTLKLGKGYDDASTWIYCYQDKITNEISAVRILCSEMPNSNTEKEFWDGVDVVLNFTGRSRYKWEESTNDTYRKDGLTVDIMRKENGSYEGLNLIAWMSGYDFSDEQYHNLSLWKPDDVLETYPLLTYDDIATGNYSGKYFCIDVIVDQLRESYSGYEFSLWYPSEGSYVYDKWASLKKETYGDIFADLKNGTILRYASRVYENNTFTFSNLRDLTIVGEINMEEVYAAVQANCIDFNYEEMMRNYEDYKGTHCQVSGSIFQVISESSISAEYLLSTDAGYVYLDWYCPEDARSMNFLEGDSVTVYGEFNGRKTYNTLLGKNTVPSIMIYTIYLN
jgi:hypothetical protein